jgi:3D-(3,5/4)-trihydroxycyclohexane-1,2-dione acylhydrolase (decyclizing)
VTELRDALARARHEDGPTLIQILTDPLIPAPGSEAWWDVPVAEVSELTVTADARKAYEAAKVHQKPYLRPAGIDPDKDVP